MPKLPPPVVRSGWNKQKVGIPVHGPIDYLIVEFPGNEFNGGILRELNKAVENDTIAVLDLSLISKDAEGQVSSVEVMDPDMFGEVVGPRRAPGVISQEDVAEVGELLHNNSSAGLLVVEHLWAKDLKRAIIDAKGVLVADGRIHPDAYEEIGE